MPARTLTPLEASQIKATLDKARQNKAPLSELARAYDLAADGGLVGCLTELRERIQTATKATPPPPTYRSSEAVRDIVLGIIAGIATEHLLSKR
jgi:hypothetical protein